MKTKIFLITIITAIVLSMFTITVNAADLSFNTMLEPSVDTLEKGKEVTITLNIFDLNVGDKGINSLTGYLVYDDKVFEQVSADDIEGLNKWSATYSESGKISLSKLTFVKKNEDVCKIKLKVKSNTSSKKTTVEFKDIVASNSDSEITSDNSTFELPIEDGSSSDGSSIRISSNSSSDNTSGNTITPITANKNNTSDDNNTNTNTSSSLITSNKNNSVNNTNTNTTNEEEMPKTGIDDGIAKAIVVVALIAGLGYIKLKSIEKR